MKLIYKLQKSSKAEKIIKLLVIIFLFVYVFSIPSFGESGSKMRALVYVSMSLLATCVFLYCFLYLDFKIPVLSILIPIFAIFGLVGTAIYSHEFKRWFSLVVLSISFIVFILAFRVLKNKFFILQIISIAFALFSILFIIHYKSELLHFTDFASGKFRLGNDFDNPNGVSACEMISFGVSLYIILFAKKKIRFLHLLPLLLSIIVGFSTGSRSFLIGIFTFTVIFLFFLFKKHKLLYLLILGITIAAFVGFLFLPFMSTVRERLIDAFGTFFDNGSKVDSSTLSRTLWLDFGFYLGAKNGVFGYGADGFYIYSTVGTYAHNNFSEVVCDFGFVGLFLFYLPLIVLLIKSIKERHVDKSLVVSFVVFYLIISFSNVLYYKKFYYMLLAFMFFVVYQEGKETTLNSTHAIKQIIFTCDTMNAGGAEKVISLLSNEFYSRGIGVTIIGVSDKSNSVSFYPLSKGIRYISLNNGFANKTNAIKRVFLLRKKIMSIHPDVVVSFLPHINIYTSIALLGTKISHIVSERNDPSVDPKKMLLRILKRVSFVLADGCVFQTQEAQDFYKNSIVQKSTVILNPCVLKTEQIHHGAKNKTILYVGRLTEQKNPKMIIESFAKANKLLDNQYFLKLYGDGPLRDELNKMVNDLKIADKVKFEGLNNEWQILEKDDALFVLCSNYEGLPNSLIESLVIGIPCISTNCSCGGPAELIKCGFNLTLVPTGDTNMLSTEIIRVIEEYQSAFDYENMEKIKMLSVSKICDEWISYIEGLKNEKCTYCFDK